MSKTIADYTAAVAIDGANDFLLIEPSGNTLYKRISRNVLLGITSQPLGLSDSQSPTNKTFDNTNSLTVKDGSLTIQNTASPTKQAVFSASGITAGQTRTFTFPDASATLVGTATTQTLTNKTITSPTITGGTIDNSTVTVDSISGHSTSTIVTVANLQISNGVLNSANAVTSTSIAAGAVQPQALVTGTGSGWSWQSTTPTWTNLTVGNGTSTGKYIQTGKNVTVFYQVILGSTSSVSSSPYASLPVTPSSIYNGAPNNVGLGHYFISSGVNYLGIANIGFQDSTHVSLLYISSSTGAVSAVTSTAPGTFTTGSIISIQFEYQAS